MNCPEIKLVQLFQIKNIDKAQDVFANPDGWKCETCEKVFATNREANNHD